MDVTSSPQKVSFEERIKIFKEKYGYNKTNYIEGLLQYSFYFGKMCKILNDR